MRRFIIKLRKPVSQEFLNFGNCSDLSEHLIFFLKSAEIDPLMPFVKGRAIPLLQVAVVHAAGGYLNHFETIREFLDVLIQSDEVHVLAIESAPGLGKSRTIEESLSCMGGRYRSVGSYSTPLHLFNTLSTAVQGEILILDDCAGLFTNDISLAILKGATWSSAGHGGERRVRWGSTTALKTTDEFAFCGKLILIANHIPRGEETRAFLQRAMHLKVELADSELANLLTAAANSAKHYENVLLANLHFNTLSYLYRISNVVKVLLHE